MGSSKLRFRFDGINGPGCPDLGLARELKAGWKNTDDFVSRYADRPRAAVPLPKFRSANGRLIMADRSCLILKESPVRRTDAEDAEKLGVHEISGHELRTAPRAVGIGIGSGEISTPSMMVKMLFAPIPSARVWMARLTLEKS